MTTGRDDHLVGSLTALKAHRHMYIHVCQPTYYAAGGHGEWPEAEGRGRGWDLQQKLTLAIHPKGGTPGE